MKWLLRLFKLFKPKKVSPRKIRREYVHISKVDDVLRLIDQQKKYYKKAA